MTSLTLKLENRYGHPTDASGIDMIADRFLDRYGSVEAIMEASNDWTRTKEIDIDDDIVKALVNSMLPYDNDVMFYDDEVDRNVIDCDLIVEVNDDGLCRAFRKGELDEDSFEYKVIDIVYRRFGHPRRNDFVKVGYMMNWRYAGIKKKDGSEGRVHYIHADDYIALCVLAKQYGVQIQSDEGRQ